ncbi:DUF3168 domain-containing protein [Ochrobactrum quorumnocens]|uniref:DUF3168 domain-containing protein n=1 Tax=Ochrobactrum quorumnocens TaxID=271865 RepID=A0A5N1K215_9HYPH|nr:DUF3168 domain-containing protein [[Ochrobactrum] quorumnocens]KAA9369560.1 DUF3168 domain-containing protein [[Ochrobactrum] quorumnocens]
MSVSVSLANFVISSLKDDPIVASLVSSRIWDHPPADREFPYISLGPDNFRVEDADCIPMREQTLQIDCWSRENGKKWPCKEIVDSVVNVLRNIDGDLTDGALVETRIDLARVIDDPDGITSHGIVQFTAIIEG